MFVEPEARGRGIARLILRKLEELAREFQYDTLILETGNRQPEAIRLYEASGYHRIPRYGRYIHRETSTCFEKRLVETDRAR